MYLLLDVIEGVGTVYCETDQDDMGVGVGERSESIVIFLAGRIPEGEFDMLSIDFYVRDVVLEHGRDVDLDKARSHVSAHSFVIDPRPRRSQYHAAQRRRPRQRPLATLSNFPKCLRLTSGNVPLENTIRRHVWRTNGTLAWAITLNGWATINLSTSTVADDDQLASDF